MNFEKFLQEMQSMKGLEELKADKNGVYSLRINHTHLIYFSESFNKEDLYLYAPLCPLPVDEQEKIRVFEQLLTANLFGQQTGHAWFANDQNSHQILLMTRIPSHFLSLDLFTSELQQLIACLAHWKKLSVDFSKPLESEQLLSLEQTHYYIKP